MPAFLYPPIPFPAHTQVPTGTQIPSRAVKSAIIHRKFAVNIWHFHRKQLY